jgi:hypothetical protein
MGRTSSIGRSSSIGRASSIGRPSMSACPKSGEKVVNIQELASSISMVISFLNHFYCCFLLNFTKL